MKNLFVERNERSVHGEETHLSMSQKYGLVADLCEKRMLSESYAGGKLCYKDDIVLNRLKAHLGVFALASIDGVISPDYTVLKPNIDRVSPKYAEYFLRSDACRNDLRVRVRGVVEGFWRLYTEDFNTIRITLPPRHEQDIMVRYLDWKVSQINKLINAKRRQIALLREQRRITIHEAVSKSAKGWENSRLITLTESVRAGAWGNDESINDVDMICIRIADFDFERLRIKDIQYTIRSYKNLIIDKLLLRDGDILIEKSGGGDNQPVGRVVLFDKSISALYANFIEAIRTNKKVLPEYLVYVLASQYYKEVNRLHFNQTTGLQNLSVRSYLRESLMLPPLAEQRLIVRKLNDSCKHIDNIISKINDELALFVEYRIRLISDVVTGKLDVSGVVVPEYDVVEGVWGNSCNEDSDFNYIEEGYE